jgi:hypothetical protein
MAQRGQVMVSSHLAVAGPGQGSHSHSPMAMLPINSTNPLPCRYRSVEVDVARGHPA